MIINIVISHPKSPEPKDDDDEVDDVGEEHEGVDISGSLVLRVENTPKEPFGWMVNAIKTGERQSNYFILTKAPHKCDDSSSGTYI